MKSPSWVGSPCNQKCFTMVQNLAVRVIKRVAIITFIPYICSVKILVDQVITYKQKMDVNKSSGPDDI